MPSSLRSFGTRSLPALALAVLAACGGDSDASGPPTPVASVTVSPDARTLRVGEQLPLAAQALDADGDVLPGRPIAWASGAQAVATVSAAGVVTAIAPGQATIAATSEGKQGTAVIQVQPVVARVVLQSVPATLRVGGEAAIAARAEDAAGGEVTAFPTAWASTAPAVATVAATAGGAARLVAVAPGTTTISALVDGKRAEAVVEVRPAPQVARVTVDAPELTLEEGASRQLVATAYDEEGIPMAGMTFAWTATDATIATVSATGGVTGVRWGTTTVTARIGGHVAVARVRVSQDLGFDLLFDSDPGNANGPALYRMDVRVPGATPARLFQSQGTWDASVSPDGAKIVFTCSEQGPALCLANRDGSGLVVLTPGHGHNEDQPAWSPDGTRIAYRRWADGATPGQFNRTDIWVMNADGSDQRNLTADEPQGFWHASPTWSPRLADGSHRIAWSRQSATGGSIVGSIRSMRADGGDRRPVTTGGAYLEDEPAWSPDGESIVLVRTGGTASGDLWIARAIGGQERQLMTVDPADDQRSPSWSPDGRHIAFTSKHETTIDNRWSYQIYTVRPDGTQLVRRTDSGDDKARPAWARR